MTSSVQSKALGPIEYAIVMVAVEIAEAMTVPGDSPYPCAERIIARLLDSGISIGFQQND